MQHELKLVRDVREQARQDLRRSLQQRRRNRVSITLYILIAGVALAAVPGRALLSWLTRLIG